MPLPQPHFEAKRTIILEAGNIPEGYTLGDIYETIKGKQFPILVKCGSEQVEIGTLLNTYLGREHIVGDLGFDPTLRFVFGVSEEKLIVKALEWI